MLVRALEKCHYFIRGKMSAVVIIQSLPFFQFLMAKVYPQAPFSSSSSRKVLTVWMKSLVMNGNGCTVYDSDGRIIYRVDNYSYRCGSEVYLMDHRGKTLTKILKKKLGVLGQWKGYDGSRAEEKEPPRFRVRKVCKILKRDKGYEAIVRFGGGNGDSGSYKISGSASKLEYQILDFGGEVVAEVRRKLTTSGVALGDDVLTLVLEPNVDQLLIMGLVIVCGLINHSM